jgi:hypothetical protein
MKRNPFLYSTFILIFLSLISGLIYYGLIENKDLKFKITTLENQIKINKDIESELTKKNSDLETNISYFQNRIYLIEESIKDVDIPNIGARRGLLLATKEGWLTCFDSFSDASGGKTSPKCCLAISGQWSYSEKKCCAADKGSNNWTGSVDRCIGGFLSPLK